MAILDTKLFLTSCLPLPAQVLKKIADSLFCNNQQEVDVGLKMLPSYLYHVSTYLWKRYRTNERMNYILWKLVGCDEIEI